MTTSIRIVTAATSVGLVLALLFAQSLSTMLYGVSPTDPATLAGAIFVVVAVAFIAALVPAARATFGRPMRALREDWWNDLPALLPTAPLSRPGNRGRRRVVTITPSAYPVH